MESRPDAAASYPLDAVTGAAEMSEYRVVCEKCKRECKFTPPVVKCENCKHEMRVDKVRWPGVVK